MPPNTPATRELAELAALLRAHSYLPTSLAAVCAKIADGAAEHSAADAEVWRRVGALFEQATKADEAPVPSETHETEDERPAGDAVEGLDDAPEDLGDLGDVDDELFGDGGELSDDAPEDLGDLGDVDDELFGDGGELGDDAGELGGPGDDDEEDLGGDALEGEELPEGDDASEHAPASAPHPTPAPAAPAPAQPGDPVRGQHDMAKDVRLGPRPPAATHWRCFRTEAVRSGAQLMWTDPDGFGTNEWAIKSCNADTIAARWGDGAYVVQYITITEEGQRRPCGRSKPLLVTGRATSAAAEADAPPIAAQAIPPRPAAAAPAPFPFGAMGGGGDATFANVLSLMAYMNEQNDRARASAAAESRAALERAAAQERAAQERYRADVELQMERERLASKERIAAIEAQARTAGRGGGAALDPDAFAAKVGARVGEQMQAAMTMSGASNGNASEEEADDAPEPDGLSKVVEMLGKYNLQPIIDLFQRFSPAPSLPQGTSDAAE